MSEFRRGKHRHDLGQGRPWRATRDRPSVALSMLGGVGASATALPNGASRGRLSGREKPRERHPMKFTDEGGFGGTVVAVQRIQMSRFGLAAGGTVRAGTRHGGPGVGGSSLKAAPRS